MRPGTWTRIGTFVIAAIAGAVYGTVGTVAHASEPWGIPAVGLVLALIGVPALLLAIRLLADRWAAIAATVGMTAAILVFSGEGPGGSVIAPDELTSVIWTIAAPLLAVIVVAWPTLPQVAPEGHPTA